MPSFRETVKQLRKTDNKTPEVFMEIVSDLPEDLKATKPLATIIKMAKTKIPSIHKRTLSEFVKMVKDWLPILAKSDNYTADIINTIRSLILTRFGEDSPEINQARKLLFMSKKFYDDREQKYTAKVANLNKNKLQIPATAVDMLLNTEDISPLACLLKIQVATGARFNEVLVVSNFQETVEPDWVVQTGILKVKKHSRGEKEVLKPFLFFNFDTLQRLHKIVRTLKPDRNTNKRANILLRKITNDRINNTHLLRKIYADLAWKKHREELELTTSNQKFLSDVLGHETMDTAKSYSTVNITYAEDQPPLENAEKKQIAIPHNTKKRDGKGLERLIETISALRATNQPVSVRILKNYGYGSRLISQVDFKNT